MSNPKTKANPKHTDGRHDAFWLAEMLRLNILPL